MHHDTIDIQTCVLCGIPLHLLGAVQDMAVTAVDPNQEMWPYARASAARHGVRSLTLVNGVAESLPFADGSFDRAVCTLVRLPGRAWGAIECSHTSPDSPATTIILQLIASRSGHGM